MSRANPERPSVYVEIIGAERAGDKALEETRVRIHELNPGNVITSRKYIRSDTSIYLVAHGDDPMLCEKAGFADKSAEQVMGITKEILTEAEFGDKKGKGAFGGKIIFEGCHTAEAIPDEDTKEKCAAAKEIATSQNEPLHRMKSFQVLIDKAKIAGNSFLADVSESKTFESMKKQNIIGPSTDFAGYLGGAHISQYPDGYGIAGTENPLTVQFQRIRGAIANTEGTTITYEGKSAVVECRANNSPEFGVKGQGSQAGKAQG